MVHLTDEDARVINTLIKKCEFKATFDVCRLECLPCSRVIDKGKCRKILEYLGGREDDAAGLAKHTDSDQ